MGGNLQPCRAAVQTPVNPNGDPERCHCFRAAFGWWYDNVVAQPVDGSRPGSRRPSGAMGGTRAVTGVAQDESPLLRSHRSNGYCGSSRAYGGMESRVSPRSQLVAKALGEVTNGERQRRPPLQNSYSESIIRDYERQRVPEEFAKLYDMRMLIGVGTTAKVYLCVRRATDKKFACKVIDKRRLDFEFDQKELLLSQLRKEIEILRQLDHPNVVRFEDVIETADVIYVVMELVMGGELFDYLLENGSMSEPQAANLMHGVMSAVAYMHDRGVVHRDLKAENLLLVQPKARWPTVKLIDFGFSTTLRFNLTGSFLGTGGYIAPEIRQQRSYSSSVDVWACGVLCYLIVSCRLPFNADVDVLPSGRQNAERRYELRFPEAQWGLRSEAVKDLIRHMLDVDPVRRWSARQVLQHPWISGQVFGLSFGGETPVSLVPGAAAGAFEDPKGFRVGGGGGSDGENHCNGIGNGTGTGNGNGVHSNGMIGCAALPVANGAAAGKSVPDRPHMRHAMSALDLQFHRAHLQLMEAPEEADEDVNRDDSSSSVSRRWERTVRYCPAVIHNTRTGDLMTTSRHSIQRYGSAPIDKRGGPRASLRPPSPAVPVPVPVAQLGRQQSSGEAAGLCRVPSIPEQDAAVGAGATDGGGGWTPAGQQWQRT